MKQNLIKLYFYVTSGQALIDKFKYSYLVIFGIYLVLKLDNYFYLVVLGVLFLPILFYLGLLNIHYISKVSEQLSVKHGTHYALKQFELQEETVRLLKEIVKKLK